MLRYLLLLAVAVAAAVEGPGMMQSLMRERTAEVATVRAEAPQEDYGGGRRVMLEAGRSGHFATRARINNRWVDVMVDTGATTVAIPYEEAVRLGIRPGNADFTIETRTANGIKLSAPVRLDEVRIGDIILNDVDGLISPRGALSVTLLGMSFLGRLSGVEMRDGTLVMTQ